MGFRAGRREPIAAQAASVPIVFKEELSAITDKGAMCGTLGRLFDAQGREVLHELSRRTLAGSPEDLRGRHVVLAAGGLEKVAAIQGLLRAGLVAGLITDGDTARKLASS